MCVRLLFDTDAQFLVGQPDYIIDMFLNCKKQRGGNINMLDVNNAREVINQLSTEQFLCNDNLISTNGYVIVKKTNCVTTDKVNEAISKIIEEAKKR